MQAVDLDALKRSGALWRGRRSVLMAGRVLGSGWAVLDEVLGGGWPRAALVEVLGDAHLGLSLLLPLLADLSLESRWLTWVAPPYLPYAPALAARGIRVERVLLVQQVSDEQALWAAEQVLKSGACSLLLAWPDRAGARGSTPPGCGACSWPPSRATAPACCSARCVPCARARPPRCACACARRRSGSRSRC